MINLTNYEIYFLDYAEGQLDREATAELMEFVSQHPQLKDELDNFSVLCLPDENDLALPFNSLLKDDRVFNLKEINESNDAYWFAAYYEGDLDENQKNIIKNYVRVNEERKMDFETYLHARLPIEAVHYPHKKSLKHFDLNRFRKPVIYSAAAVITAFLLVSRLSHQNIPYSQQNGVHTELSVTLPSSKTEPLVDAAKNPNSIIASVTKNTVPKTEETINELNHLERSSDIASLPAIDIVGIYTQIPASIVTKTTDYVQIYQDVLLRNQLQEYAIYEEMTLADRIFYKAKQFLGREAGSIPRITFYDMARYGIDGFNELTGNDVALKRSTDEKGNLLAFAFGNENFRIASVKKDQTNQ